jgi:virginiamycin B lyase
LTVTLNAHGHTDATPAHYWFQYATNAADLGTARGQATPRRGPIPPNVPGNGGELPFGESIGGLTLGTTYYYRVCGRDRQTHRVCSNTQSFVTAATTRVTVVRQVPSPASASVPGIVTGPDGALWVTEGDAIDRITTGGQLTQYSLRSNSETISPPVVGPDGALWFGDGAGPSIDRVTEAGELIAFPLPQYFAAYSLSVANGALWFVGPSGAIGRITTTGAVSAFPVADAPVAGNQIVTGSDGALWFTTPDNKIGRLTTTGAETTYVLPDTSGSLGGITAGPDGALWFTETPNVPPPGDQKIGRITTAGVITEFPLPSPAGKDLGQIIVGPDNALWFTGNQPQGPPPSLNRITTSGHFSQGVGDLVGPLGGLTAGPDGALWATVYGLRNGIAGRLEEILRLG